MSAFVIGLLLTTACATSQDSLEWTQLPPVPDAIGVGGPFAGTSGGALIVAGGANFPDGPPWEGGGKVWYDRVWVLDDPRGEWSEAGRLPHALAYGASVTIDEGLLLIGGDDGERVYDEVRLVAWTDGALEQSLLPALPRPSTFLAAGVIGRELYVAAGQETLDATSLIHEFWSLDLDDLAAGWANRPPWPGRARIKAACAVQSNGAGRGAFHLFSGEIPRRNDAGEIERSYVTDGYRFVPGAGWDRVAQLPAPVAAAGAIGFGQSHVLVFSGSTGAGMDVPIQQRPTFPRDVLAYHTITDTWTRAASMPEAVVTTAVCEWNGRVVICSGETRPGVRTAAVQSAGRKRRDSNFGWIDATVLIAYLGALVALGARFARREKSTKEFFLAGRRIPWWAAGISIYATQLSAITFIATPAVCFATDWRVFPALVTILLVAPIVVHFYLPFFRRLDVTTAYEFLEQRFDRSLRLFGSASFIAFQVMRSAIVLYLPALALSSLTGLDVYSCIAITGLLATLYTVMGGIEAVIWTDVLQAVVLVFGIVFALGLLITSSGGVGEVIDVARDDGKLLLFDTRFTFTGLASWSVILGSFFLNFGPYTTDQAVVQRYLTTTDERSAARGLWLNGILCIPFGFLFFALGTALYVFFKSRPELIDIGMANDEVFPLFVARQLPVGISGLVIAGIFAASMSSLDSSVHSVATAFTTDFFGRRRSTDASRLRLAKTVTITLGTVATVAACILSTWDIRSLFFFFQKVLGLLSSGVVGIFILGIFTRRANGTGAWIGIVASLAALAWVTWGTELSFYLYAVIGIGVCVGCGYGASLLLPSGARELEGLTYWTRRIEEVR